MNTLGLVHLVDEVADLDSGVGQILILTQGHFLFLDGPDDPFRIRVRRRLAPGRHADLDPRGLQAGDIARGGVLHTLVGVMDVWPPFAQGHLQGAERQIAVQVTPQLPAAQAAGEDIQHDGQVNVALRQTNVRNIRAPDLIGTSDREPAQQIRIAAITMPAVRGADPPPGHLDQVIRVHQAVHPLVVNRMLAALQLGGHPGHPIGRELEQHLFNPGQHRQVVVRHRPVVQAAARHAQQLTQGLLGIVPGQFLNQLTPVFERECSKLDAFFNASSSMASRPTMRSNSAMRACSADAPWPPARS